jgi:3-dehydroquinate synthase II/3-amino-4-hydroxybenzoic acid synthase
VLTNQLDFRPREVWIDVRELGDQVTSVVESVGCAGFSCLLVAPQQLPLKVHGDTKIAVARVDGAGGVASELSMLDNESGADDVASHHSVASSGQRALFGTIASEADLTQFANALSQSSAAYGIVDLVDETNIPLELLIAWFQRTPTKILKRVPNFEQADIALRTLQHGADGILIATNSHAELRRAKELTALERNVKLQMRTWEVTSAEYVGWGHRALVDTVSLLTQAEGMLVGSSCNAFAVMCSETHHLPYMPLRPFRVNAAAVHSYLVAPGNKTHYLGDLQKRMKTLVVASDGTCREATVGRVKIERRPLILIEFRDGETQGSIVVQADWHVRIMGADGEPINVTHCKPGTRLLGWATDEARHCGNAIAEDLIER